MKRRTATKDWLPLVKAGKTREADPTGEAFRPEWLDFEHGIRVGNLEPHERITRILKYYLEGRYGTPFVTDRWGRGVFWQWICWLPRANREAKPLSNKVNFGCAKLFICVDQDAKVFQSGLQIERGYAEGPEPYPGCLLQEDWDWHRLVAQCADGTVLDREFRRLLKQEDFVAEIGDWSANAVFNAKNFDSARQLHDVLANYPRNQWVGFQLYFPMPQAEVEACSGFELVKAMCAVFAQVVPAMNACMQVPLTAVVPDTAGIRPGLRT